MRAYWSYIEALTTQGFGSAEAVATMATYHGLAPKMTLAAAAYNESSFAYAGSLLDAAEAKAASESDRAKLTVMRQVIPTPSHLLDRISPISSPFPPVFCAFSPSR